jgi:hypothetical protein
MTGQMDEMLQVTMSFNIRNESKHSILALVVGKANKMSLNWYVLQTSTQNAYLDLVQFCLDFHRWLAGWGHSKKRGPRVCQRASVISFFFSCSLAGCFSFIYLFIYKEYTLLTACKALSFYYYLNFIFFVILDKYPSSRNSLKMKVPLLGTLITSFN